MSGDFHVTNSMQRRREEGELNPLTAALELTLDCNLRCRHCYLEHQGRQDELSTAEWLDVIDQMVAMDVFFAGFTGGEVLCREDFLEIAAHALSRGVFFHIQTNGTLIDEKMADAIQELKPTKVELSIYGATAASHDWVTRVPGSFEKTLNAVRLLKSRGIKMFLKTTVMSHNRQEVPAIRELAENLGVWYVPDSVIMPGVLGDRRMADLRMNDEEYRQYMISQGWGRVPDKELETLIAEGDKPIHRVLCTATKKRFAVTARGEVTPCVIWRQSCGNIRSQSLDSIWRGEAMRKLRRVEFEDLKECPGCDNYESCVRCAGMAFMETGDCLGCPPESRRMSDMLKQLKQENLKHSL